MKGIDTLLFRGVDNEQVIKATHKLQKKGDIVIGMRYFDVARQGINSSKKRKSTKQLFVPTGLIDPKFIAEAFQVEWVYKSKKPVVFTARIVERFLTTDQYVGGKTDGPSGNLKLLGSTMSHVFNLLCDTPRD